MTGKFMTDARFEEVTELAACYLDRDPEVSQALTDCQEEIIWLGSRLAAAEQERDDYRATLMEYQEEEDGAADELLRSRERITALEQERDALREQNARLERERIDLQVALSFARNLAQHYVDYSTHGGNQGFLRERLERDRALLATEPAADAEEGT